MHRHRGNCSLHRNADMRCPRPPVFAGHAGNPRGAGLTYTPRVPAGFMGFRSRGLVSSGVRTHPCVSTEMQSSFLTKQIWALIFFSALRGDSCFGSRQGHLIKSVLLRRFQRFIPCPEDRSGIQIPSGLRILTRGYGWTAMQCSVLLPKGSPRSSAT